MSEKHYRTFRLANASPAKTPAASSRGFKLLELMIVAAIGSIMVAVSVPSISTAMSNMHLTSASGSLASALQSARYMAISNGCPVQVAVLYTRDAKTGEQVYQVTEETISANTCTTTYVAVPNLPASTPFAASDVAVTSVVQNGTSTTLSSSYPSATVQFNANGTVTAPGTTSPPISFAFVVSQSKGTQTNTINVSGVGYVKVTSP